MDEIHIDVRLMRRGSVWCAVALVRVPGCKEPIPMLACVDCAKVTQMTGADAPTASAVARTEARNQVLEGVIAAFAKGKPVDAQQIAKSFDEFKHGMGLCAAAMRGDPRATLAIVDLHQRAEHDGNPEAKRQMNMLRECMEATEDGRCSFRFTSAGLGQMYRPMNNPMQGGRRDDMASGRNPAPGPRMADIMSGRNPMPGARPDDMASGRNPRPGPMMADMISGRNPMQGARPDDMVSGPPGFASRHTPQGAWVSHGNNPRPGAASRHGMVN
jgi:hypothetical protein